MLIKVSNTIRIMNKFHEKSTISKLIYYFNRIAFACDIMPNRNIHRTVRFPHNALGTVIHQNSKVGKNSTIYQNVTVGGRKDKTRIYNDEIIDAPIIGSNVLVGTNSIILGPIIVGDNAIIGAGAVVVDDVPPNSTVYGEKSKIKNNSLTL